MFSGIFHRCELGLETHLRNPLGSVWSTSQFPTALHSPTLGGPPRQCCQQLFQWMAAVLSTQQPQLRLWRRRKSSRSGTIEQWKNSASLKRQLRPDWQPSTTVSQLLLLCLKVAQLTLTENTSSPLTNKAQDSTPSATILRHFKASCFLSKWSMTREGEGWS